MPSLQPGLLPGTFYVTRVSPSFAGNRPFRAWAFLCAYLGHLNLTEQEAWRKCWTKLLRQLFPEDRRTGQPTLPGTVDIWHVARMPGPSETVRAERLLHFVRLVGALQETLLELLLHEYKVASHAWLSMLKQDLAWAIQWGGIPATAIVDFPDSFVQHALDSPVACKRLVKKAAAQAPVSIPLHCQADATEAQSCPHCGLAFDCAQELHVHLFLRMPCDRRLMSSQRAPGAGVAYVNTGHAIGLSGICNTMLLTAALLWRLTPCILRRPAGPCVLTGRKRQNLSDICLQISLAVADPATFRHHCRGFGSCVRSSGPGPGSAASSHPPPFLLPVASFARCP